VGRRSRSARALLGLAAAAVAAAGLGVFAARALAPPIDRSTLPAPARAVPIGDGLSLNVEESGSGSPIVLVHGLPSNIGDWGALPQRLAERGHHVVVYDRIGYGWSSRVAVRPDTYTLASSARELAALLDRLGISRATLVGWSYGGGVVQLLATEAPERVDRLVLVGSVGPAQAEVQTDPVEWLAQTPLGPLLFHWVGTVPALARRTIRSEAAEVFSGSAHVPDGWVERTAAQLALPGTVDAWIAEERHGWAGLRPEDVAAPSLVVEGAEDRVVPPRVAEDLAARLPHARLILIPGGSHMLPLTHADDLAERIHAWATGDGANPG
jgi:pimeloyl-ACP methyl ester carboxylesterase